MTSKWGYTSPEVRLGSHHGTSHQIGETVEPGSKIEFLKGNVVTLWLHSFVP